MHDTVVNLVPPILSDDAIKEKIICIRGHKERMFNTSYERIGAQHIFHNYGHGGAGWTFLFGCVQESIRQFEEFIEQMAVSKNQRITVIGAGCYGLLTAIELTRRNYRVRIVAEELHNLASYKAAGFFFPRPRKVSNDYEKGIFYSRGITSYKKYISIIEGTHPYLTHGPLILPAFYGTDIDPGFGPYIEHHLIEKPEHVVIDFGNGKQYAAHHYNTLFINPHLIMKQLVAHAAELNIPIVTTEIKNFSEIDDTVIFNCAGLGAKKLAQDARMLPIQGHLITLQHQPIDKLQYLINFKVVQTSATGKSRDELIYYAPKEQGILGITFLRGVDSLTSNYHEFNRLLERSRNFFGS
jgi:hypothetical protein